MEEVLATIASTEHNIMMMNSFRNEDIYRKRNGRRVAIMVLVTLIYFLTGAEDKEDDVRGVVVPTTTNKTDAPPIALNSELKIYVYDLPFEYSLENYIKTVTEQTMPRSNCDWNMNVCKEEEWVGVSIYYEYFISHLCQYPFCPFKPPCICFSHISITHAKSNAFNRHILP